MNFVSVILPYNLQRVWRTDGAGIGVYFTDSEEQVALCHDTTRRGETRSQFSHDSLTANIYLLLQSSDISNYRRAYEYFITTQRFRAWKRRRQNCWETAKDWDRENSAGLFSYCWYLKTNNCCNAGSAYNTCEGGWPLFAVRCDMS